MGIRPLHTEDDYHAALADVSALVDLDPEAGTPEGDRLEVLSILVERYEAVHCSFKRPDHSESDPAGVSPTRRFGALTGRASMSADFDKPLQIDEAVLERAARDNPDLPLSVIVGMLQGLAEARAGKTTPFTPQGSMKDYNTDLALWAVEQAAMLRAARLTELDRNNIADELESLARALRRELADRLVRLLQHLLQWHYLDGLRLPAWYGAILEERDMIPRLLNDAPSLGQNWPEAYAEAWDIARENVCYATGLAAEVLPHECPYSRERALTVTFWPGAATNNAG